MRSHAEGNSGAGEDGREQSVGREVEAPSDPSLIQTTGEGPHRRREDEAHIQRNDGNEGSLCMMTKAMSTEKSVVAATISALPRMGSLDVETLSSVCNGANPSGIGKQERQRDEHEADAEGDAGHGRRPPPRRAATNAKSGGTTRTKLIRHDRPMPNTSARIQG